MDSVGKTVPIVKMGLGGDLLRHAETILEGVNTDWSLFNTAPEKSKCAAVVLYEHLNKPKIAGFHQLITGSLPKRP